MKTTAVNRITWLFAISALTIPFLFSCGPDDPSPIDLQREELTTAPWGEPNVTRDGLDVSDDFLGFVLTFNQDTYKTTNGGNAWPSSGTWEFQNGDPNVIVRDAGTDKEVVIAISITEVEMTATFTVDEPIFTEGSSGSRLMNVPAQYSFTIERVKG